MFTIPILVSVFTVQVAIVVAKLKLQQLHCCKHGVCRVIILGLYFKFSPFFPHFKILLIFTHIMFAGVRVFEGEWSFVSPN